MKEWSAIYITELGELKSVCQLLQVMFSLGGGPKAILNDGGMVKSIGHTGDTGGGWRDRLCLSLEFWAVLS